MASEVESSIDAHLKMIDRRADAAYQVIKAAAEEATAIERARIVAALRKWAACMRGEEGPLDDDGLREAWKNEIDAADTFATQIENGSL